MGDGKLLRNFKGGVTWVWFDVISTIGHRLMWRTDILLRLFSGCCSVSLTLDTCLPTAVESTAGWCLTTGAPPRKLAEEELPAQDLRVWRLSPSLGQLWRAIPATAPWDPLTPLLWPHHSSTPPFAQFLFPLLPCWWCSQEPCPGSHLRTHLHLRVYLCRPLTLQHSSPILQKVGGPATPFLGHLYPFKSLCQNNSGWASCIPCFCEVSDSYQDTKVFLHARLQTAGESRDDPFPGHSVLQWEARAHFLHEKENLCCGDQLDLRFCGILLGNYDMVYLLSIFVFALSKFKENLLT